MASTPETHYALSGGNHIAYQVADGAERDILYVPRTTTPIDLLWEDPLVARGLRRLTACGRLIMCDLRGWGSSDSIDTTQLPALQAWMDDIIAVLDAAAVHIGARVAALADADEVLVSAAVPPLVAGAAIRFTPRGIHQLKGVPDEWAVYSVKEGA